MEIREIQGKDIPAILELVAGTMTSSTKAYIEEYKKDLDKRMCYYLEHKEKSAQYVALDKEKVIGFVLAGVIDEEEIDKYYFIDHANPREPLSWVLLGQITVDVNYRGRNIGSKLIDRTEQRAREMNMKGVYTGTRSTIRFFYEKNGFVIDKVFLKRPVKSKEKQ